jgi:hypothetical protein
MTITIKALKELVKDLPEIDPDTGEDYEVWIQTGEGLSSPARKSWKLNKGDLLLEYEE